MRRTLCALAPVVGTWLLVGCLIGTTEAGAAWKTVTVILEEPDGSTREVRGTGIAYGHYIREFTPKGTKDRLRVEKNLVFPDRIVRFLELDAIEFDLTEDSTAKLKVPTVMRMRYRPKRDEILTLERKVSELKGYGQPKPIQLIVTTAEGKVHLDLTPPYDDEARQNYRPILNVEFE